MIYLVVLGSVVFASGLVRVLWKSDGFMPPHFFDD